MKPFSEVSTMTATETRTLIKNAFKLPGLASQNEMMIGIRILESVASNGLDKMPPQRYPSPKKSPEIEARRQCMADILSDNPLGRSDISELFPDMTPGNIRDDLAHLRRIGLAIRIGTGNQIKYIKQSRAL
ncbi:hypothetical protein [Roseovarius aestuarii]|uniref:CUE domain-containing protein n=1 Tax=Roseovarius aestuarii TaxID=475083 RepID=A0A1X7BU19_9RHOB|nr:hypothetical protein [Roseovarius aestuarii]SMC13108.1 hypothetical protein ROA7745_02942 [Roseovarius aestuarii]